MHRRLGPASLLIFGALALGCGGSAPAKPGPAPTQKLAPTELGGCRSSFGRSFFINDFTTLPAGQGFDLDGDGKIDNEQGNISGFINSGMQAQIQNGQSTLLVDLTQIQGPPLVEGSPVKMNIYAGIDANNPPTPQANIAGQGRFYVPSGQFDVDCHPTSPLDMLSVQNGNISGKNPALTVVQPGFGTTEWHWFQFSGTLNADYTAIDAKWGAALSACTFSTWPYNNNSSALDVYVNLFQMQPDMDFDGDGLAQLVSDGTHVVKCITASGVEIDGPTCPCDPRVNDGYSMAFHIGAVPAQILGTDGK